MEKLEKVVQVSDQHGDFPENMYTSRHMGGGPAQTSHAAKKNKKWNQNGVTWGGGPEK